MIESVHPAEGGPLRPASRPRVSGKFIYVGEDKLRIRGVTYGAFEPDADGNEYHDAARIRADFALMAANGMNAVRIPHTAPPRSLLDIAAEYGLRVMVGLSLEQQIGYFLDRKTRELKRIEDSLRSRVGALAGHPALLCYALGNEIPASLARWIGRRQVQRILERMYRIVKREDPQGLVTYVNYPTTEYLQLQFLDLLCFNVYLETQDRLSAYLSRLQNLAGDRPLIMSELGLDALRNGEDVQADMLRWQIRTSFDSGCAGVFVFSWTDEWYRAGAQVDDWAFGLTDIARRPKPALAAVREAFSEKPWSRIESPPSVSVVVCTYNGSATIRECLARLDRLDYPDLEIVVVDDGSDDGTAEIVAEFGCKLIRTEHRGLSNARNAGLAAARGAIIAYIDDDAYPDRDWLRALAAEFADADVVAAGGPNVSAPDDPWFAQCVGYAPGNPTHVLLTDTEAEQLAGCNLAIRRTALEAVGGFDPRFRTAGDDVDVCWRLHDRGGRLAFAPAAMVWHHRRRTLAAFLKQQIGYGEAEAWLDDKWPEAGEQARRAGRVYRAGAGLGLLRSRIYHGVWGHAPFQSLYTRAAGVEALLVPIAYVVSAVAGLCAALGFLWHPLWLAWPALTAGLAVIGAHALVNAIASARAGALSAGVAYWPWIGAATVLEITQPLARAYGRLRGMARARAPARVPAGWRLPTLRTGWVWSERWLAPEQRIAALETELRAFGVSLTRGGDYDAWDLELRAGLFGGARLSVAVEDHSGAAQMVRYRLSPRFDPLLAGTVVLLGVLAIAAAADHAAVVATIFAVAAAALAASAITASGRAVAWGLKALDGLDA